MGKSTISMAIFNSFLYVYQAGYILMISPRHAMNQEPTPQLEMEVSMVKIQQGVAPVSIGT